MLDPNNNKGGRRFVVRGGKIPNPNINSVLLLTLSLLSLLLLRQQQRQLARHYHYYRSCCSASAFVLLPSSGSTTGGDRAGVATAATTAKKSSSLATSSSSLPSGHRAEEVVVPPTAGGEGESMPALLILERVDRIIDPCSMTMTGTDNINNYYYNNRALHHRDGILESVDREHVRDVGWAEASTLPFEGDGSAAASGSSHHARWNATEYCEYIRVLLDEPPASAKSFAAAAALATRTKRGHPLLTGDEVDCLMGASEFYRSRITVEEGGGGGGGGGERMTRRPPPIKVVSPINGRGIARRIYRMWFDTAINIDIDIDDRMTMRRRKNTMRWLRS